MDFFSVLSLIGGLALFLYGMDVMGDGLKKLSGSKLEMILAKLTSNRIKGFLLGFVVTAIIQSSSATTVMLVGFVNSGLMTLGQTISTIMGANIGTTVTSWLLSLSSLSGESFIIKILKPSSFTPILAIIGVILQMASKKDKHKYIGLILIGFSVLIFGMDAMSDAVSGLKDSPTFARILIMFQNPIMGILTGTILTAIIQSSSASVGILQALSMTGTISFSTAFPIILGQNIGTTITPILSSISGNIASKRVAFSCLSIKMIGVAVVTVAFYALNAVFNFAIMNDIVNPGYIAIVHTVFNIVSTVILMPFCSWIEKLAIKTIKSKNEENKSNAFDILDERFLTIPSFAVEKSRELVCSMAEISRDAFVSSIEMLTNHNEKTEAFVSGSEATVDTYEDKLGAYLVRLAGHDLSEKDSKEVTELLHIIGDFERISDHAVNMVEVSNEMNDKKVEFSPEAKKEVKVITDAVCEILIMTTKAFLEKDYELAKKVEPLEQRIDKLKRRIKNNHIKRLGEGVCTVELGFILSDLLTNCARVSDHCSNIAVSLLEVESNSFEAHEYLNHVKYDGENDLFEHYAEYKKKYSIKKEETK